MCVGWAGFLWWAYRGWGSGFGWAGEVYSAMLALCCLGVLGVGVACAFQVWLSYLGRSSGFVAGVCLGSVFFWLGWGCECVAWVKKLVKTKGFSLF